MYSVYCVCAHCAVRRSVQELHWLLQERLYCNVEKRAGVCKRVCRSAVEEQEREFSSPESVKVPL